MNLRSENSESQIVVVRELVYASYIQIFHTKEGNSITASQMTRGRQEY